MSKPRLLDLFCGAGGASMGYCRAGFDVVGVDIVPQPHYPFEFIQGDALEYAKEHGYQYDAIHASPPCQLFSAMRKGRWQGREHPDLLKPTRTLLLTLVKPYIIENVPGAPLNEPITLCGTMFGLETSEGNQLRRHRLFESPSVYLLTPPCRHNTGSAIGVHGGGQHPNRRKTVGVYGNSGRTSTRGGDIGFGVEARKQVMGVDWMTGAELTQAIPPAYTEFIGKALMEAV